MVRYIKAFFAALVFFTFIAVVGVEVLGLEDYLPVEYVALGVLAKAVVVSWIRIRRQLSFGLLDIQPERRYLVAYLQDFNPDGGHLRWR